MDTIFSLALAKLHQLTHIFSLNYTYPSYDIVAEVKTTSKLTSFSA